MRLPSQAPEAVRKPRPGEPTDPFKTPRGAESIAHRLHSQTRFRTSPSQSGLLVVGLLRQQRSVKPRTGRRRLERDSDPEPESGPVEEFVEVLGQYRSDSVDSVVSAQAPPVAVAPASRRRSPRPSPVGSPQSHETSRAIEDSAGECQRVDETTRPFRSATPHPFPATRRHQGSRPGRTCSWFFQRPWYSTG